MTVNIPDTVGCGLRRSSLASLIKACEKETELLDKAARSVHRQTTSHGGL
jgi:hypothetical protein